MTADIKGLEQWEGEATAWAKRAGDLKTRAGIGMLDALESWYKAWLKKPTERNKRETLTWRLRLLVLQKVSIGDTTLVTLSEAE